MEQTTPEQRRILSRFRYSKTTSPQTSLGEFLLSSDSIGHTYSRVKKMSHIIDEISHEEIDSFFSICSTIGAYIIFPAKRINNKMTINGARGVNHKIQDRFDLLLNA